MILSGPMVLIPRNFWYQARLSADAPKKLTPEPAKVIFDVDASVNTRSGFPAAVASPRMSMAGAQSSTRGGCTAYALSQKIRKSGAAAGMDTSARATSSE